MRVERAALFQIGDKGERLERRTRLALAFGNQVVVALPGFEVFTKIEAARHRLDRSRSVLDGGNGSGRGGPTALRQREPASQQLIGPLLEVEVDSGGYPQATFGP